MPQPFCREGASPDVGQQRVVAQFENQAKWIGPDCAVCANFPERSNVLTVPCLTSTDSEASGSTCRLGMMHWQDIFTPVVENPSRL